MRTGLRSLKLLFIAPMFLVAAGCASLPAASPSAEATRWEQRARSVTITRDDWGIAHVRGRTDADAVFGMIYAQAEDDFPRIERNYLVSLGRLAEAEGEGAVMHDLRQRLFIDPAELQRQYGESPAWLRALMDAWADGLNHYLATHPEVRPRVITRFEPWMALSFSEGSIGGDIERISPEQLGSFYRTRTALAARETPPLEDPDGSNGFAIAPARTAGGNALLLINPHTSFYFRSELQMTSEEGLNAYGAATWGQFFIYQGFNDRLGWMHTSSTVDNVDEFLETITRRGETITYRYGNEERPVTTATVTIAYRQPDGTIGNRSFTTYRTHHGPIIREQDGKWVSIALMHRPVPALMQSYLRTKARDHAGFMRAAELKANSSNNTIYADADGNIAYLHPQFIPRRDDRFDFTHPVDGSDPATDWRGLHELSELPRVLNPSVGWIQNTNNWPYSAAGPDSPRRDAFPRYMDTVGETPRGIAAQRVLAREPRFTLESLRAAAYDPYMPAFATLVPQLVRAYDAAPASDPLKRRLAEQIALLRGWDYQSGVGSEATSLAIHWGNALNEAMGTAHQGSGLSPWDYLAQRMTPRQKLQALDRASNQMIEKFGRWRIAWGEINRFQRLTGDILQPHRDDAPSIPVGFAPGGWGSLASFAGRQPQGTRRFYGSVGNSFVAVVEFGPRVRARAVSAGGESGDPRSPHFNDQAGLYARGELREVYFYPEQLQGHIEQSYRPGGRSRQSAGTLSRLGRPGTPSAQESAAVSQSRSEAAAW